jgi:hypothetical protein
MPTAEPDLTTLFGLASQRDESAKASLITIDDPQNVDHVTSPVMRERSWAWPSKDVLSASAPGWRACPGKYEKR